MIQRNSKRQVRLKNIDEADKPIGDVRLFDDAIIKETEKHNFKAPGRLSVSGLRWCTFCDRVIAPNARVCIYDRPKWEELQKRARRERAEAMSRRATLAKAFSELAEAAADAAATIRTQELDPVTARKLDAAIRKVARVRRDLA